MSQFRIAICGTFDIENYGDLLFPELFDAAMRARGIDCDLVRFAPVGGRQPLTGGTGRVHSLSNLEAMHKDRRFDGIVVGGGALVQLNTIFQRLPGSDTPDRLTEYAIYDTWVIPALVSASCGVPLYWNAPDVPYRFDSFIAKLAGQLIAVSDYICVRNETSRANLLAAGLPDDKITLCPDTALAMASYFTPRAAEKVEVPFELGRYVVVQLNRHLGAEEYPALATGLDGHCRRTGDRIVLLPLANTHGDSEGLARLQDLLETPSTLVQPKTIFEMAHVISRASLYVGVSFHGAITAVAYGVKAIAYNYMRYAKTRDLFDDLGVSQLYAETADQVLTCLTAPDPVSGQADLAARLTHAQQRIERHFDAIRDQLLAVRQSQAQALAPVQSEQVSFNAAMIDAIVKLAVNASANRFEMDHVLAKIQWLEAQVLARR